MNPKLEQLTKQLDQARREVQNIKHAAKAEKLSQQQTQTLRLLEATTEALGNYWPLFKEYASLTPAAFYPFVVDMPGYARLHIRYRPAESEAEVTLTDCLQFLVGTKTTNVIANDEDSILAVLEIARTTWLRERTIELTRALRYALPDRVTADEFEHTYLALQGINGESDEMIEIAKRFYTDLEQKKEHDQIVIDHKDQLTIWSHFFLKIHADNTADVESAQSVLDTVKFNLFEITYIPLPLPETPVDRNNMPQNHIYALSDQATTDGYYHAVSPNGHTSKLKLYNTVSIKQLPLQTPSESLYANTHSLTEENGLLYYALCASPNHKVNKRFWKNLKPLPIPPFQPALTDDEQYSLLKEHLKNISFQNKIHHILQVAKRNYHEDRHHRPTS